MAEVVTINGKSLEELEREITCGVCQEYYYEPKILPCLHYYCKTCVLKLAIGTTTGQPFSCPECRQEATLPEGGVDELKTAFFINRLQTTVSTIKRSNNKIELKCELCKNSEDKAEAFCQQCTKYICQNCVDLHERITTFEGHEVASLDDLKHGQAKPILVEEPPATKCLIHEKSQKIYCYDCTSLICRDCTVKDHREHNFEFVRKAAPDEKLKLQEKLQALKDLQLKFSNAVEQIQKTILDVEAQEPSALNTIKTSFKELHAILDRREKELAEEVKAIVRDKVHKLSMQEKTLSLASAEVLSIVHYTERCVRHCTNYEVMSMLTEVRRTIEKKTEQHKETGDHLYPEEEANIEVEVKCAERLQELCETSAVIIKLIDPAKYTVSLNEERELGKVFTGTLKCLYKKQSTNRQVSCTIKSLYNKHTSDCDIDDEGSGSFVINYTPTDRGRHELSVLIDKQHVAGSPFPVLVSIHPTQQGKPVIVWTDISNPGYITTNSRGNFLCCQSEYRRGGSILKIGAKRILEKVVNLSQLTQPRSIACNTDDKIYCIDHGSNKILTCDDDGRNIEVHEVQLNKGSGRSALLIVNNELLLSEAGHKSTIMVYNRELNYVRQIQHEDMGQIIDLSVDLHGNIYAIDRDNSCVQVFSSTGVFLHNLTNQKKLKQPSGVCVSGPYVYITEVDNHRVSVFRTDGTYVTSIGQRGSKKGEFNHPYHIHADKNGFIFVSDNWNHRIQCF